MRSTRSAAIHFLGFAVALFAVATAIRPAVALAENPGKRKPPSPGADAVPPGTADAATATHSDTDNPIVQLIRDPRLQRELNLTPAQMKAVDEAYARIETRLFLVRDVAVGPGADEKAKLLSLIEPQLDSILEPTQRGRLQQVAVRARGWPGICASPRPADSSFRRTRLRTSTRSPSRRAARCSKSRPRAIRRRREAAIVRLRKDEGDSIQKLLSGEQQQLLTELVGAPFDLAQVPPLSFRAPEIARTDAWLNSSPLKFSELRGKVVAFHFWAFNCGNCLNNLPHYARWHEQLASRGLVVLGMHTPETQAERNVDTLRERLKRHAIRYPVAVDHESANWAAWANAWWPSVYLIDKRGRVRYWWYGELNWQGAQGEELMRQRIDQLLAERE